MMKIAGIVFSLLIISALQVSYINGQDDETRRSTGLPTMIGPRSSDRVNTTVSGKITIQGLAKSSKPSVFVVAYFSGALIDRRQANDNGDYYILSVPREGVTLSVEVGGVEIGRYQLASSIAGSIRQDITLNLAEGQSNRLNNDVIFAKSFYQRSTENQKAFDKAFGAAKEKKTESAVALYSQLLKDDPKDFVAWGELGTLYFRNEKFSQAEESYQKAIEASPEFTIAQINLGKLYFEQKQYDKAIVILTKAAESEPTSADAQHYLGESYLQLKKGSKAVNYLYEAIGWHR